MVEYNFLCVHVDHRNKRITPILYREIARRANQEGIFQAAFTAAIVIPKPMGICRYYHRSLNPKKLIETGFSHLPKNKTMETVIKTYKLPEETKTSGLTELTPRHLDGAYQLLTDYLNKFDFVPKFEREEFDHFFLPRKNVAYSYVVEKDGKVTDMISFFNLSTTVLRHPIHKQIRTAYSFYNVATTTSLVNLMEDALILAQRENFDVFNALTSMENQSFFDELKFRIGDGELHYYLYNWKCPDIESKNVGLVFF
uniref:Glycylpeptide N-tetradecanoyltransferase n=1 Tax=Acrobeloides nanus TaxID=290746 RepID=A0A914CJ04_9BILA